MKSFFGALALCLSAAAAGAEGVSELAEQGLVVLNSHYDTEKGVIVFLMGDVQGAPLFVCQTRFDPTGAEGIDKCRKLR